MRAAHDGRLAAFLAGMACGAVIGWASGPLARRVPAAPGRRAAEAAGQAADYALGRIHGLLGEIRALMEARAGRTGGAG